MRALSRYCAKVATSPEEQEACTSFIDLVIRQGVPLLTKDSLGLDVPAVCNTAVEGTCSDSDTTTAATPTSGPGAATTCSNCKVCKCVVWWS